MKNSIERLNPRIWSLQTWQRFFVISGIWNVCFFIPAVLMPKFYFFIMYGVHTDDFYRLFLNTVFMVVVLIFGIGYLIVAYDPPARKGIVFLGAVGKIVVGIMFYYLFAIDRVTLLPPLAGTGDLIFTLYFVHYLVKGPQE